MYEAILELIENKIKEIEKITGKNLEILKILYY